jgi:hypothetical protein
MQRTRGGIQRVSQHQLRASDDRRTRRLPSQAPLTKRLAKLDNLTPPAGERHNEAQMALLER